MGVVRMIGGPKDDKTYDYPDPLPKMLVFQHFDPDTAGWRAINYRRHQRTCHYLYVGP